MNNMLPEKPRKLLKGWQNGRFRKTYEGHGKSQRETR